MTSQAAITRQNNILSPSRFLLVVRTPDLTDISFWCTNVTIPSIDVQYDEVHFRKFSVNMTGSKIKYNPLSVKFIVDEDLYNYTKLQEWLVGIVSNEEEAASKVGIMVIVHDNANNPIKRVTFTDCFPLTVSELQFDTTLASSVPLYVDVEFSIQSFRIESIRD